MPDRKKVALIPEARRGIGFETVVSLEYAELGVEDAAKTSVALALPGPDGSLTSSST